MTPTSTRAVMGLAVILAVGSLVWGLRNPGSAPSNRDGDMVNYVHFSYVDDVGSPADLMAVGELVFFGQPLGSEVLLRDFTTSEDPGVKVFSQAFTVTTPVKGEFESLPIVNVIRTHFDEATIQPQPAFSHPLYLLAVRSTQDSYGVPAWYPIGGPSGRIPLGKTATHELVALLEDQANGVQAALVGLTDEQIMGLLQDS